MAVEADFGSGEHCLSGFRCPFLANEESVDVMLEMNRLANSDRCRSLRKFIRLTLRLSPPPSQVELSHLLYMSISVLKIIFNPLECLPYVCLRASSLSSRGSRFQGHEPSFGELDESVAGLPAASLRIFTYLASIKRPSRRSARSMLVVECGRGLVENDTGSPTNRRG